MSFFHNMVEWLNRLVKQFCIRRILRSAERRARSGDIAGAVSKAHQVFTLRLGLSADIYQPLQASIRRQYGSRTSGDMLAVLAYCRELLSKGKGGEIQILLQNLLKQNPACGPAYEMQAEILRSEKQPEAAIESYRVAIVLSDNRTRTKPFEEVVQSVCRDNTLLITQVAHNYLPILDIWYSYIQRFDIPNMLVIALGPLIYNRLHELEVPTYLLPIFSYQPHIEKILWYEVVKLRKRINAMGIDYIHTDADAFWLRNPLDRINSTKGDIVGSIGYGTPKQVVKQWGFRFQ